MEMRGEILCPRIAKRPFIITKHNMDSLLLTTYKRHINTSVVVSCITPKTHRLEGDSVLKCMENGQWNKPIPRCIHVSQWDNNLELPAKDSALKELSPAEETSTALTLNEALPYIITVSVLALMFIALIVAIIYLAHLRRRLETSIKEVARRPPHVRAVESMLSLPTASSTAYDFTMNVERPPYGTSSGTSSPSNNVSDPYECSPYSTYPRLQQTRLKLETESTSGSVKYSTISDYLVYR